MKTSNSLTITLSLFFFLAFAAFPALAQTDGLVLTVTSTADSMDAAPGDRLCADALGQCTLRAAVNETNANSTRDVIIFDLPRPSVIDLKLGELTLDQNLDIIGPGARQLTVRRSMAAGTPNFRIFHLPATIALVTIRAITISNGSGSLGGGILIESGGFASLFDVAVTGNHAETGGGIAAISARLTIARCLINSNNATAQAGAIFNNGGYLAITSSTLTGNSAPVGGAVISNNELLLLHDTFSGNSATKSASSVLNASPGTAKVLNTIIGRDTSTPLTSIEGTFQSAGNNIVTNSAGSSGFANGVNGDQVSENNVIDPLLAPLADTGGQTNTMAPLPGSPARDNGNICARTGQCPGFPSLAGQLSDQRRRRRPFMGSMDVGSHETDGITLAGSGSFSFSSPFTGPIARFVGTPVELINPSTLERRHSLVRTNGDVVFLNLPTADVYVLQIRAKRNGAITPLVLGFDF